MLALLCDRGFVRDWTRAGGAPGEEGSARLHRRTKRGATAAGDGGDGGAPP
jgi:hypothetical protein